jgi:hypothetical protein
MVLLGEGVRANVGSVLGDQKACLLGGTAVHAPG